MAFLGNDKLKVLLSSADIISDYDEKRIKNGAYELSLGDEVFQTNGPSGVKNLNDNEHIEIKPGQFALLLTKELVKIPQDRIAFISIKAGIKFKGLVNVSGFHVDPGFEGKLLFSVYNAGPANILLTKGKPYFPIWFAELDGNQDYKGEHEQQKHIPTGAIESLSQGELASPNVLNKKIDDLKAGLSEKMTGIERDQKAINYLAATALVVFVGLAIKLFFDPSNYESTLRRGIEIKGSEIRIDSIVNAALKEKKKLLQEIDSLNNMKSQLLKK